MKRHTMSHHVKRETFTAGEVFAMAMAGVWIVIATLATLSELLK